MKYLLDINALIALAHVSHIHHTRMTDWYRSLHSEVSLFTTPITELGFVRVTVQVGLQDDIRSARIALNRLTGSSRLPFALLPDDQGVANLPGYVKTHRQLTDGHLIALARKHGCALATLDQGIPGATVIP